MISDICRRLKCLGVLLVLALAPSAALAAPARASTRASAPAPSSFSNSPALGAAVGDLDYGGQLALDIPTDSGISVGPRFTGEVMYGLMDLAPQLRLAVGGRASFAYHSTDFNGSLWILEGVPDAKIKYAINDMLGVYGDVGLGLALVHTSLDVRTPSGTFSATDNTLCLAIQLGGGATYAITPNLNLLGEIRFDIYTRSGSSTFIALPTVGVQWHY